jgi:hypothetical protein
VVRSRGREALRKFGGDRCRLLANDTKASQINQIAATKGQFANGGMPQMKSI